VSFVFNVWVGRSITVLPRIDHVELDEAAALMTSMNTSKQNGKPVFMRGLVKRRQEETALFRMKP
jgi:GH24 family phage-related lysozyme (muramidase)